MQLKMASIEVSHGRVVRSVVLVLAAAVLVVFAMIFLALISASGVSGNPVYSFEHIYNQENLTCALTSSSCNLLQ